MKTSLLTIALFATLLFWSSCKEKSTEPVDEPCVDNIIKLDLGKDTVDYVQRAETNNRDSVLQFAFFETDRYLRYELDDYDSLLNVVKIHSGFSLERDIFNFGNRGKICNSKDELVNIMNELTGFSKGFKFHRLDVVDDINFRVNYPEIVNWDEESVLLTYEYFGTLRDTLSEEDLTKIEIYYNECKKTILANRLDITKLYPTHGFFRTGSATMSLTRIPKLPSDTKVLVTWREEKLQ